MKRVSDEAPERSAPPKWVRRSVVAVVLLLLLPLALQAVDLTQTVGSDQMSVPLPAEWSGMELGPGLVVAASSAEALDTAFNQERIDPDDVVILMFALPFETIAEVGGVTLDEAREATAGDAANIMASDQVGVAWEWATEPEPLAEDIQSGATSQFLTNEGFEGTLLSTLSIDQNGYVITMVLDGTFSAHQPTILSIVAAVEIAAPEE